MVTCGKCQAFYVAGVGALILFGAVYPLYEISIWIIMRFERTKEAQLRAEGLWVDEDEA